MIELRYRGEWSDSVYDATCIACGTVYEESLGGMLRFAVLVYRSFCHSSTNMEDSSGTILSRSAMLLLLQATRHYRMKMYGVSAIFAGERQISG